MLNRVTFNRPTTYWWRTAEDAKYKTQAAYTADALTGTYFELTTTQPADDQLDRVGYLDWDAANNKLNTTLSYRDDAIEVAGHDEWGESGETTWYYVKDRTDAGAAETYLTLNGRVTVTGHVNLILCDNADLIVVGGIEIENGASLTIYGQTAQSGKAKFTGTTRNGIQIVSGGSLTINGGNVTSSSTSVQGINALGTLTVNSGKVTATGYANGLFVEGKATVNGGQLNATGRNNSGIAVTTSASATEPAKLTINGGTVIARSENDINHAVILDHNGTAPDGILTPPATYWWRTADTDKFTKNTTAVYTPGAEKYAEITTTQPDGWVDPTPPTNPSGTTTRPTTKPTTETVTSPKTTDPGVLLTGALSVASLLGMGYVSKKR